jgi:predicted TIM-barrel fold metal-dependent hydrolase
MRDASWRRGFAQLARLRLCYDAWVYYTQLGELVELADAFPGTPIVLDHVGAPIGVAEYRKHRGEVIAQWNEGLRALASRPNVFIKVGGMGMTVFGFGFEDRPRPAAAAELASAWQPIIDRCLEIFGPGRCMFENNFPPDNQSCSCVELWNASKLATRSLSEHERRDLFYRTACRVYALPRLLALADGVD